jgi:bacterioferritin
MSGELALDIERIRAQARERMQAGPRTPALGVDPEKVIDVLNDVVGDCV